MPCAVESASLEPKLGNKFVAGGEDMWIRLFDFHTGDEIGELQNAQSYFYGRLHFCSLNGMSVVIFSVAPIYLFASVLIRKMFYNKINK